MGKEKILYIILGVLFIAYVLVEYYAPKPLDWSVTFSEMDKNPYGGYILYDRLEDFYSDKEISFQTLYESRDSTKHLIILTERFEPSQVDIEAIYSLLDKGNSIFIAASYFAKNFTDTLGLKYKFLPLKFTSKDSTTIHFNDEKIKVPDALCPSHFETSGSQEWSTHAEADEAVLISRSFEESRLVLSTTPLLFTNYGIINDDYRRLAVIALKLIPEGSISYNRFYHWGKPEADTPLRYLLSQAALRWAVYLSLFTLIAFLIFGSGRTQRPIPVLELNRNTTIEFIKTIGGLYHRGRDHKNAAEKLIQRFLKSLGEKYHIHEINEKALHTIAYKKRVPVEEVIEIFQQIESIKHLKNISEDQLKTLYNRIKKLQG